MLLIYYVAANTNTRSFKPSFTPLLNAHSTTVTSTSMSTRPTSGSTDQSTALNELSDNDSDDDDDDDDSTYKRSITATNTTKPTSQRNKCKSRVNDKQRHNQLELQRRERMKQNFDQLRSTIQCERADRCSILNAATEKIRAMTVQIQQLQEQLNMHIQTNSNINTNPNPDANIDSNTNTGTSNAPLSTTVKLEPPSSVSSTATPVPPSNATLKFHENISVPTSIMSHPLLSPIARAEMTLNGQFVDCTDSFCDLLKLDKTTILRNGSIFSIFSSDDLVVVYNQMIALAAHKLSAWTSDKNILAGDYQYIRCTAVMALINNDNTNSKNIDKSNNNGTTDNVFMTAPGTCQVTPPRVMLLLYPILKPTHSPPVVPATISASTATCTSI